MMNNHYYTGVRNVQIVLYLLKARGIRKVIASPGTQNMSLVVSMQHDSFFEMFSAADERSAAYMACGLAAESGEPVVLSCTGATASRNYIPGLTEAFYRHLPIVAITSTERVERVGHNVAQVIDRSVIQKDIAKCSVLVSAVNCDLDAWNCMIQVNKALLELRHHGTGPVHINLEKVDDIDFSTKELKPCHVIDRIVYGEEMPDIPKGKVAIFIGSHAKMSEAETNTIDCFCAQYDAVVLCDHTSGYYGNYRLQYSLVASQEWNDSETLKIDVLIQLGEISGDYYLQGKLGRFCQQVWRVNEDGEIKDNFKKLRYVFEMKDISFFSHYALDTLSSNNNSYYKACENEYRTIYDHIPELPFCNIWMAKQLSKDIPKNSVIHFGILNSLRAWNFFEVPTSVETSCNVGGFGIDGGVSTLIGASLAHPDKIHFGIFGDLAFFYDMNVLGNRHVGKNVRIMLVNNAKGSEFKLYSHPASLLGEEGDSFVAAAGHYGNKSSELVKHYAVDLGFAYFSANNKEEFLEVYPKFIDVEVNKPMLLEVFTDAQDESDALKLINSIAISPQNKRKSVIKKVIGEDNAHAIQRIIDKIKP